MGRHKPRPTGRRAKKPVLVECKCNVYGKDSPCLRKTRSKRGLCWRCIGGHEE